MFDSDFLDFIMEPVNWDRKSYAFNREEKDMHPYTVHTTKDYTTIVHNVTGIDKKDLKMVIKADSNGKFLVIEGKTTDIITNKQYTISSTFQLDDTQLDIRKVTSRMSNGLLYITIPNKKEETFKPSTINIEIL